MPAARTPVPRRRRPDGARGAARQLPEINNFYTPTVYEKGAEVVRMMHTLVGRAGFAKGMSLYFERHDGQAVTCDDFAQAIADANPGSELAPRLEPFKRWYSQPGTPRLTASGHFDAAAQHLHADAGADHRCGQRRATGRGSEPAAGDSGRIRPAVKHRRGAAAAPAR